MLWFWSLDIQQAIKTTHPRMVNGIGNVYDCNVVLSTTSAYVTI